MSFDGMINRVLSLTAGAARAHVEELVLKNVQEFCERTNVWHIMHVLDSVADQQDYTLPAPGNAQATLVLEVRLGGHTRYYPADAMNPPYPNLYNGYTFDPVTNVLSFTRLDMPAEPAHIEALVAYKPMSIVAVPAIIWQRHSESIVDGTLYDLLSTPNRPYTAPNMAMKHGRRFKQACGRVKRLVVTQYSRKDAPWRFPLDTRSRTLRW